MLKRELDSRVCERRYLGLPASGGEKSGWRLRSRISFYDCVAHRVNVIRARDHAIFSLIADARHDHSLKPRSCDQRSDCTCLCFIDSTIL